MLYIQNCYITGLGLGDFEGTIKSIEKSGLDICIQGCNISMSGNDGVGLAPLPRFIYTSAVSNTLVKDNGSVIFKNGNIRLNKKVNNVAMLIDNVIELIK